MKKPIPFAIILLLFSCLNKSFFKGKYGDDSLLTYIEFLDNNEFKLFTPSGSKCGNFNYDRGTFHVESDTLFLNMNYNYPKYEEDYNKQSFEFISDDISKSDSLIINLNVIDLIDNYPLPKTKIKINEKILFTDYDGNLKVKVPVNQKQYISAKIFDTPVIDTIFVGKRNTEINVSFNAALMDLSKNYVIKYKIIEISGNSLVLKSMSDSENTLKLARVKE